MARICAAPAAPPSGASTWAEPASTSRWTAWTRWSTWRRAADTRSEPRALGRHRHAGGKARAPQAHGRLRPARLRPGGQRLERTPARSQTRGLQGGGAGGGPRALIGVEGFSPSPWTGSSRSSTGGSTARRRRPSRRAARGSGRVRVIISCLPARRGRAGVLRRAPGTGSYPELNDFNGTSGLLRSRPGAAGRHRVQHRFRIDR